MTSGNAVTARQAGRQHQHPAGAIGALVIGSGLHGLGVIRSLGRHGIPVWVLRDEQVPATASRYARRSLPWPALDEAHQCAYLLDLAERYDLAGWVLFPTSDEAAAMIGRHHAALSECFRLTTPSWEVIRWAYDKRNTYRLAADLGLDHPWTRIPANREEVAALDCDFPVILKPAIHQPHNHFAGAKAWRIENHEELLARYDEACAVVAPEVIMVQELIPAGAEQQFAFAALCVDGRPLASAVAGRGRQYPVDFGEASSYIQTVDQPEIEAAARRFLAALNYTGLVQIQFKRDPRDGRYKLLDVNARVWGSHTLCQRAGVDFPYLCWQLLQGRAVPEVRARTGVRWVRMKTDLRAAAAEMRRGRLTLGAYLRSLRGPLEFAVVAVDDPLPAVVELPQLLYRQVKRRVGRWAARSVRGMQERAGHTARPITGVDVRRA
ncbi:MAG: ATP-grasp domain-containing protein [Actinomycetota bacterium]|nr:ATP-grasp domain-containing protein [Actinomycetota bacterium]